MTKEHYLLLAAFLGAFALQLSHAQTWADALKPSFVAGFVFQLAIAIRALWVEPPNAK
jgi:hypothetical protein